MAWAVRWLIEQGIRQFLDVGSGIPTMGNVHEIAQSAASDACVAYVDIDPVAIAHSKAILATAGAANIRVIQADLTRPTEVLHHPEVRDLLDFSRPMAVLLNAVLHFVSDADDPAGILTQVRETVVRGSYVTMTHGALIQDVGVVEKQAEIRKTYRRTPTALHLRTVERIRDLLAGWDVVESGVVSVTE